MTTTHAFPSLRIRSDGFVPQGSFAENQAEFLEPDAETVKALDAALSERQIGVVAHFYMDAQLQGVLSACQWPLITIADSLAMADAAVGMVEAGARAIVVLGVDFMSENVRAVLSATGHDQIPVYRVASASIGCSLAESAESRAYAAFLEQARQSMPALHVIYINTSLEVKALSHSVLPTITCTSSNVVQTVLQAFAQIPGLQLWYGPDTYMGENLQAFFRRLSQQPDETIARLHPAHDRASLTALLERFHFFQQGACIVHHMFGEKVVEQVARDYGDAYLTAHLEVPGEMFALAADAQEKGRGVVGSTSDILRFISARVDEAVSRPGAARLPFVLGTEAGMVTSIVNRVRGTLGSHGRDDVEVEIIFPVASEAVAQVPGSELGVVPGVAGGEGCSTAGGCATCPYMKMNSLEGLLQLVERIEPDEVGSLSAFHPRDYGQNIGGRTVADLGGEPILHMRHFQKTGQLPASLVEAVRGQA